MSVIVRDPCRVNNVYLHVAKNHCCNPCSPPICCYPCPPLSPCDPCDCCTPPRCPPQAKSKSRSICPSSPPPHSGPLPCRACYDCASPRCCPLTFG